MDELTPEEGRVSVEELEREALTLPANEREQLAMALLTSLRSELKYEAEWAAEADRRAMVYLPGGTGRR